MKAFVIILFLCFPVLRGHSYTYARVHHDRIAYSPAGNPEEVLLVGVVPTGHALISADDATRAFTRIVSVEHEEDEQSLSRKYVLAAKYYSTLFGLFLFASLLLFSKPKLPLFELIFRNPSGKYILQRVLRL